MQLTKCRDNILESGVLIKLMMYTDTPQSRKENENIDQFWHIICCKYVITTEFLNELSEFPPTKMSLMPKDNKL